MAEETVVETTPSPVQRCVKSGEAYKFFWTRWTFKGRASRSELWWTYLMNFLLSIVCSMVDSILTLGLLSTLFMLAAFFPSWALNVRRLHDTGRSGWWLLLFLIPFIDPIVLFVFFLLPSEEKTNAYGPVPNL